jgi:hypothetical protein
VLALDALLEVPNARTMDKGDCEGAMLVWVGLSSTSSEFSSIINA